MPVSADGFCDAATRFYAAGHDLADPLLSPVYGDVRGFPPTVLTTGTRDLPLSNTVRTHRELRQAAVEAVPQVFEGRSHARFYRDDRVPEMRECFSLKPAGMTALGGFLPVRFGEKPC